MFTCLITATVAEFKLSFRDTIEVIHIERATVPNFDGSGKETTSDVPAKADLSLSLSILKTGMSSFQPTRKASATTFFVWTS